MNFIKRHFNNKFFKQKGPSAFKKAYEAISKSKVYEQYCQRVHGQETKMLNTMALDQYQLLVERINELSPKTMLDLGCGNGELTKQISKELSIKSIGIDFSFMGKDVKGTQFKQIDTEHFKLEKKFDLVIEQTFFCALQPNQRKDYVKKMAEVIKPGGKLAGVLFDFPLTEQGPPFGGSQEEFGKLFKPYFTITKMERCYNSIKPRMGNELFFELIKP